MSRDDHYGFVQSESLASMQCSSVPDLRAVMHYSRPTLLCAHAYITLSKLHAYITLSKLHAYITLSKLHAYITLSKLHTINVILTSYCGQ